MFSPLSLSSKPSWGSSSSIWRVAQDLPMELDPSGRSFSQVDSIVVICLSVERVHISDKTKQNKTRQNKTKQTSSWEHVFKKPLEMPSFILRPKS